MKGQTESKTEQTSKRTAPKPINFDTITVADVQRFAAKCSDVDPETGCIEWLACRNADGYGLFWWHGRRVRAHRFYFVIGYQRDIQPGMVLDHLCRNRGCVAPWHLKEVTDRENLLADGSLSPIKRNVEKTHCDRGHSLSGENLVKAEIAIGRRSCRACNNAHVARDNALRRRGETWTDDQFQAYADAKYAEYMAQATLFDGESVA